MNTQILRRWATPLTMGAFLLMSVTGIMMFFHIELGLIKPAHEWLSWAMVIAVALHVILHWRSITMHLSRKSALAVMGVFALILATAMLIPSDEGKRPPGGRNNPASALLLQAPLTALAGITNSTPDALLAKLAEQGLKIDNAATSLQAIAEQNQRSPTELLGAVLR